MKFHGNPSSGSRHVPCGQTVRQMCTDGHDEANSQFHVFVNDPEIASRGVARILPVCLSLFSGCRTKDPAMLLYLVRAQMFRNGCKMS